MARRAENFVCEIGSEIALPFARDYCRRWRVKHDPEAGEGMWWAGAFIKGNLRAVVGLACYGTFGMIVSGIFTDGSLESVGAAKMLAQRLAELPCDLFGTLHLPSQRARKLFRTSGWTLAQGVL
jgi:hypothetical protein